MGDKVTRTMTPIEERLRVGELVAKRGNKSMADLVNELGYAESSLYAWQALYNKRGEAFKHRGKAIVKVDTADDKDAIIAEQAKLIRELENDLDAAREEATILQRLHMAVGKTL